MSFCSSLIEDEACAYLIVGVLISITVTVCIVAICLKAGVKVAKLCIPL